MPAAHAVIVLDGAGWHQTGGRLKVPHNISLLRLPPYSPELNPVENIWQILRQNQLSNRVFNSYTAIVDACCEAWNNRFAYLFLSTVLPICQQGTHQGLEIGDRHFEPSNYYHFSAGGTIAEILRLGAIQTDDHYLAHCGVKRWQMSLSDLISAA